MSPSLLETSLAWTLQSGAGGSSCLIRLGRACPGCQATFARMIPSCGLWLLLLVLPRMIQLGLSGHHLSLDDPVRGAAAPAA